MNSTHAATSLNGPSDVRFNSLERLKMLAFCIIATAGAAFIVGNTKLPDAFGPAILRGLGWLLLSNLVLFVPAMMSYRRIQANREKPTRLENCVATACLMVCTSLMLTAFAQMARPLF